MKSCCSDAAFVSGRLLLFNSGYKRVLVLQDEKNSVDGWWSHNDANVLKTTELYT